MSNFQLMWSLNGIQEIKSIVTKPKKEYINACIRSDYSIGFVGYQEVLNLAAEQDREEGISQYYYQQKSLITTTGIKLIAEFSEIDSSLHHLQGKTTTFWQYMLEVVHDKENSCLLWYDADYTASGIPVITYPVSKIKRGY